MSSSGQAQPTPQQQKQRVRKPPFAEWPTIKILTPPQGQFSPKTDEWCMTYCSQTVSGRIKHNTPSCRSICVRKVFPHEVRNLIAFKNHRNVDPEGKAKYPLPVEGQPANLPRYLGGKPVDDNSDSPSPAPAPPTKYWNEGWYFWTTNDRWAVLEKTHTMAMDLEEQQKYSAWKEQRKEVWQDYQDHLKQSVDQNREQSQSQGQSTDEKWWGHIVPPRPLPDVSHRSLLVTLPPEFPPLLDRINKLLVPSHQVLGILRESIKSGEQKKFAQRVWEKAWTDEPFVLASRTFTRAYERWKERDAPDEDDPKKGAP